MSNFIPSTQELSGLKPLTTDQYDTCKVRATERVKSRIGEKPTRAQFRRDLGPLWAATDILAGVVFIAALAVSSAHIISHMSSLSNASYASLKVSADGIVISQHDYTVIHQLGMIALAEASMLLFMVMHGMSADRRAGRPWWARWFSLPLVLALMAGLFVFVANWQSNIGILESLMPPMFTVGLGVHIEQLIVESLRRRDDVTRRYLETLSVYERAQDDVTTHPDYRVFLAQEVWQKLVKLKVNNGYRDALHSFKRAAVYRELQRDIWAYDVSENADLQTQLSPVRDSDGHREVAQSDPLSANMNGNRSS